MVHSLQIVAKVFVLLSIVGCEAPPDTVAMSGMFVGNLEETDVAIGLTVDEGNLIFYSGGGEATISTHSRWFKGNSEGEAFTAQSSDNWVVVGTLEAGLVSGTMTSPEGSFWKFSAFRAQEEVSGLYRYVGEEGCVTGVVVISSEIAQGAWCDGAGQFSEVTPMSTPIELSEAGIAVQVAPDGQEQQFFVQPMSWSL